MLALIFLLSGAFGGATLEDTTPSYPLWPDQFTVTFNQTTYIPLLGSNKIKGTMYYDATNVRSRVDRDNGRHDRYCGSNGLYAFYNTPCTHFVVGGYRYLWYPEYSDCCYCCPNAGGCGLVKNTWLQGAQYKGQTTHKGFQVYEWNQPGLQDNYYYETIEENPSDRVMIGLYQEPNDLQDFLNGWVKTVDSSVFDLPSQCSISKTCDEVSVCTGLRSGKTN